MTNNDLSSIIYLSYGVNDTNCVTGSLEKLEKSTGLSVRITTSEVNEDIANLSIENDDEEIARISHDCSEDADLFYGFADKLRGLPRDQNPNLKLAADVFDAISKSLIRNYINSPKYEADVKAYRKYRLFQNRMNELYGIAMPGSKK